jgi:hypothetical protein
VPGELGHLIGTQTSARKITITGPSLIRCPVCRKQFAPADSPAAPFCSDRCRTIDLARWLEEKYHVPAPPPSDDEDSEAAEAEGE